MQPKDWSISGLSVELRRDRRTINRIIADHQIEPVKERGNIRYYRIADLVNAMTDSGDLDLEQERAKLAQAQRRKVDMQIKAVEGDLIEVEAVKEYLSRRNAILKSRLQALPAKLAPRIVNSRTAPQARDMLKTSVNEILTLVCRDLFKIERKTG